MFIRFCSSSHLNYSWKALLLTCAVLGPVSTADARQVVSHYAETGKLMRAPQALGVLGDDLFGDKINYYTGSLDFTQVDISLPGNSALPVSIGRRLKPASGYTTEGHFGNWDIDIPHLHGIFATAWTTGRGTNRALRCSKFGAPPDAQSILTNNPATFRSFEYWHGNFMYVPGQGDQELLARSTGNTQSPGVASAYPVVTRNNWQVSCITSGAKEYFLARSPDGTSYRFDWEVSRPATRLEKMDAMGAQDAVATTEKVGAAAQDRHVEPDEPVPTPMVAPGYLLDRVEVFLFPTLVTDRYGNTVTYTFDPTNRWQLKSIVGNDIAGSPRTLSFAYESPTSKLITSVSDGSRTWRYAYQAAPLRVLNTVTLPDNSSWQLGGLAPFLTELSYLEGASCELGGLVANSPVTGTLSHPSGAIGEFTLSPTRHGRTGVINDCRTDVVSRTDTAIYPKLFDTLALTRKSISGPGVDPLVWSTTYPEAESSWLPCPPGGCTQFKTVEVSSPAGFVTRHRFGTVFRVNDGQVLGSDVYDDAGNLLRSTSLAYTEPVPPRGVSDQGRGDGLVAARVTENSLKSITQQGVTFTWHATAYNDFAQPTKVARNSSLGSRTELTTYENNVGKWILGQVGQVMIDGTRLVPVTNIYNTTTANLESITKFGRVEKTLAYHPDGTLASSKDERKLTTSFSNYKRGIPQTVAYADTTFEYAVVNNIGNIDSVTNHLGFKSSYTYDAMGRIALLAHPPGDTVAWLPTAVTFAPASSSHQDLPAGHWVQTTTTGNARATVHYDAMWRPVYAEKSDTSDAVATMSIVKKQYDKAGKLAFESYPKRSYAALGAGTFTVYDALGRIKETRQDSELGVLTTSNDYASGFVRNTSDARGYTTKTTFQAFDQPSEEAIKTIVAPPPLNTIVVSIERDIMGKPTSITRSGGGKSATRSYVYDGFQMLCKTIEPETGATIQDYDLANNVSWRATGLALPSTSCDRESVAANKKMSFTYDNRNRLKDTVFGDGSPGIVRTYTADGLPATIGSGGSVWTNTYNKRRLHEKESLAYGGKAYNIVRSFDPNGSLSQISYPISNLVVSYNPNALGEPRQVGSYATGITYHPNGALAGFTYGNGIKHSLLQNVRGLPQQSTDTGVISDVYAYDKNANVNSITDVLKSTTTRTMSYDALNRLKTVSAPAMWGNAVYEYDALDNLISTAISGGATVRNTVHTIDPVTNRISSIANGPAKYTFAYQYDAQGNITKRGDQLYVFDQGNRMTSATGRATYAYDGMGHRFSTVGTDGVNRVQIYTQGGQLLYNSANGAVGTNYIYLGRHQVAEVKK